jgi:uncharacterized membrane protein YdbT with pleckstrin-like domain
MIDSNIVYQARLHPIIFFWPSVLLIFAGFVSLRFDYLDTPAMLMAIVAVVWGIMVWMTYIFSALIIKKKHVILKTGFVVRNTLDIPLSKVESIDIRQSLLGSLFHYGSLVITGTGGSRQIVNYLGKPLTCRRHIEQLLHG